MSTRFFRAFSLAIANGVPPQVVMKMTGKRTIKSLQVYIHISDEEWYRRLAKRNEDVLAKKTDAYYVDDGLAKKFQAIFEKPEKAEDIKVF